jgi:Tol biopolymer transport system component
MLRKDLQISGTQPRVGPRNDSVVFTVVNSETGKRDIYLVPAGGGSPQPDQLQQVTNNGSHDDCPAWDPSGRTIFFRSNRGGEWGIWKIAVK